MTDLPELMRLKYAIKAIRQRTLADLEAVEELIDRQIPAEDQRPGPHLPASRKARAQYYRDKRRKSNLIAKSGVKNVAAQS